MNRTSLAIILIIAAITSAGFWWYGLHIINLKESEVAQTIGEIASIRDKNVKSSSIQALADDVKLNMSALDKAFVKHEGIANFIDDLENLAAKSRVKISVSELSADEITQDKIVGNLHVRADVEGSQLSVNQFVKLIESSEPILVINRVVFTRFEDEKKSTIWRASLEITGYVIN